MFERISQLAERAATRASRREFLGKAASLAGGLAVIVAGLLVPRTAHAGGGKVTCVYFCSDGSAQYKQVSCGKECPPSFGGKRVACVLYSASSSGC